MDWWHLCIFGRRKDFLQVGSGTCIPTSHLDEASKKFTTINTSKGLYQYTCLPFGVSSAPAIFQRMMEGLLQGIPNVSVYLDDILIAGKTEQDHLTILEKILSRLQNAGIRLKRSKCAFMLSSIDLGHRISADGLQPTKEKVRAISEWVSSSTKCYTVTFISWSN